MLRHRNAMHSDSDFDDESMSGISEKEDIFGPVENDYDHDDSASVKTEESMEIDPWEEVVEEAFSKCQSQYDSEVTELMKEDSEISDNDAQETIFEDMKGTYRKALMNAFGKRLLWFNAMKKDAVYKAIKSTINQLVETEGYDSDEALKYAILKRRFLFDKILRTFDIPQLEEEDDSDLEEDDTDSRENAETEIKQI